MDTAVGTSKNATKMEDARRSGGSFKRRGFSPTCPMPAEGHGARGRPGGQPEREEADGDAAKVGQEMRRVRHDGQAVSGVSTCRHGHGPGSRAVG